MIDKTENEIIKHWETSSSLPLVSISCATYNHEQYIAEALDGFLSQETNFPFEIIVGEDCSTDNTRNIIEEYQIKYPNIIKPILWDENVGAHKNWNTIVQTCEGQYIANCEGDDYWSSRKKLQTQIDEMYKYPNINFSFHLSSCLYNHAREIIPRLTRNNKIFSLQEMITSDFHLIQTNTIMFKRESLKNLNMDIMKDSPVGDVWIKIATSIPNGAIFINEVMSTYRVQSIGSWSESMQSGNAFLEYVNKMLKSIDEFDMYWDKKYTKEFKIYKNKFIRAIIKKENINKLNKKDIIQKSSVFISKKNLLLWHIIYCNDRIKNLLKFSKRSFLLRLKK